MDWTESKHGTVTRLALCGAAAALLYAAADKWADGCKVPALEAYLPWLRENKVEAIAIAAAILFGVSLVLWPLEPEEEDPCAGYEAVD